MYSKPVTPRQIATVSGRRCRSELVTLTSTILEQVSARPSELAEGRLKVGARPLGHASRLAELTSTTLEVLMRRFVALTAFPLLACAVLAGCGSSSSSSSSASSTSTAGASSAVTATGLFGKAPTVNIPKAKAGSQLEVKTLIQGTGTTLTKADALAANFVADSDPNIV